MFFIEIALTYFFFVVVGNKLIIKIKIILVLGEIRLYEKLTI